MRRYIPTVAASLTCAVVVALGLTGVAGEAGAADRSAARTNAQWLAGQLAPDGTLQNPLGGELPDHGLMIDTLFALHAAGTGELAVPIADHLDAGGHASDYFTWDGLIPDAGFDAIIMGGAAAKLLVAAEVAGRDPRAFGGYDLVAETRGAIMRSGPDKGRVSDYSKNPDYADFVSNEGNMFGQSLAVIGLAGAGEPDQLAVDTLVSQQCDEGYFRIFFGYIPTDEVGDHVTPNGYRMSTCDEGREFGQSNPDGDATGLALSALLAARAAGVQGLDKPIARAVAWLTAHQAAAGGWGGGVSTETANTNSTGLIVQALADHGGAPDAVTKGVAFLKSAQVTAADETNALKDHIGAIAYTPADYQAARESGITGVDTWIRASAQASLGLSQVGFFALTRGDIPVEPPPAPTVPPTPTPTDPGGDPPTTIPTPTPSGPVTPRPVPPAAITPTVPQGAGNATLVPQTGVRPQAGTATPVSRLGAYLAAQLTSGEHVEVTQNGERFVDYDATAELVLALHTLGEQPAAVRKATRFLLDPASIQAYAHGAPYETGPAAYAEPLAKLRIIGGFALADEKPPADLRQTIDRLGADLAALRADDGRFVDVGTFADTSQSTPRHAWAVLATVADSGSDGGAAAVDLLIARQCDDGLFPATLDGGDCTTGDLAATSAAIQALNARPAAEAAPSPSPIAGSVPEGWSPERVRALQDAVTALTAATDGGLLSGTSGAVHPGLSAIVAAGRQAAGLDVGGTARALGALLRADGGLAAPGGSASDLPTSVSAAPGVAGRSWSAAADAPVVMAVRLPLTAPHAEAAPAAQHAGGVPIWLVLGLVVAGALLAVALQSLRRFVIHRNSTAKAVTP